MRKYLHVFILGGLVLILAACGQNKEVIEEVDERLKDIVNLENKIDELRFDVSDYLEEEQFIFNEMMDEGDKLEQDHILSYKEEVDHIIERSDEKLANMDDLLADRADQVKAIDPLTDDIKDEAMSEQLLKVIQVFDESGSVLADLHGHYADVLKTTADLYLVFENEGLFADDVYEIVDRVNEQYDLISADEEKIVQIVNEINEEQNTLYELFNQ
ncbi:MAG TPA: YkyA family protein [Pseudogracilibacillus sp.]|nr:YkyA family protein [Pseudogracilibacillus sp.]